MNSQSRERRFTPRPSPDLWLNMLRVLMQAILAAFATDLQKKLQQDAHFDVLPSIAGWFGNLFATSNM